MISEKKFREIDGRIKSGDMPSSDELREWEEFALEMTKAQLAENPVEILCPRCGGTNTVSDISGIVKCEWCGEPLLLD